MTLFTSKLVKTNGKIVSIEPNPDTMSILVKNMKRNGCENVIFVKDAIGSELGQAVIYSNWNIKRGCTSLINATKKPDIM